MATLLRTLAHLLIVVVCVVSAACGSGPEPASASLAQADAAVPAPPPPPTPEELLRSEVKTWISTPYADNGTTRQGVGNAAFVRAVLQAALGTAVPATQADQYRFGRLVERDALAAGDLVFFETKGIGPLRTRTVGLYLGGDEVAMSRRDAGVTVVKLSEPRWDAIYRTARRAADPNVAAPTFDAARYGSNRAALLRDIAVAWRGTLYRDGGTTFDGIGNDEFVREVYGAIHEVELRGNQQAWGGLGEPVDRASLQPGDVILYESRGIGGIFNQRHAGLYIDNGEFVHAMKGAAVSISKLDSAEWKAAFRAARRIDPEALARAEAERAARVEASRQSAAAREIDRGAPKTDSTLPTGRSAASPALPAAQSAHEQQLRAAAEPWWGTPYKIGGTSKSGVDCSAFVRAVYGDAYDIELPRTAEEQERLGTSVAKDELESGDLVFFRTQGMGPFFRSRHVGVYLGNGVFAHASGKRGVTTSRLDDYYWSRKYAAARRLAKPA